MFSKLVAVAVLSVFCSLPAAAEEGALQEEKTCPPCPTCPPCEEPVDPSNWKLNTSLGFNLTRGNSDTLLLNNKTTASREINDHIYRLLIDGSFGEDKDKDDPVNGNTTQKQLRLEAAYKHLLTQRWFLGFTTTAFFDEIADIDYRYILSPGIGYFLVKNDTVQLSLETGPSWVFEKLGGEKNDYLSPRVAERFDWKISETSKVFQSAEVLLSVDDGDDTLVTAEAGISAAINSSIALVVSVKNVYDNLPAAGKERNDLMVLTGLQFTL